MSKQEKNNKPPPSGGTRESCWRFATSRMQQASLWIANLATWDRITSSLLQASDRHYESIVAEKSGIHSFSASYDIIFFLCIFQLCSWRLPILHNLTIMYNETFFP